MDQKNSRKPKAKEVPETTLLAAPVTTPVATPVTDLSFEAATAQLELVVKSLEDGQLPLAQALAAYQQGAALLKHAQSLLDHVQTEIEIIESQGPRSVDRDTLIAQIKEKE
jgi:exodeoxyribonuclease VII small subunit